MDRSGLRFDVCIARLLQKRHSALQRGGEDVSARARKLHDGLHEAVRIAFAQGLLERCHGPTGAAPVVVQKSQQQVLAGKPFFRTPFGAFATRRLMYSRCGTGRTEATWATAAHPPGPQSVERSLGGGRECEAPSRTRKRRLTCSTVGLDSKARKPWQNEDCPACRSSPTSTSGATA
eukprot:scaffold1303_cov221-Pinguiococcus_pyrenoidosus.AAC.3